MSLLQLSPVLQALLATTFTWGITAAGAALVFFIATANRRLMDLLMGFGAGVMIAASYWSLLNPAIELCGELGYHPWLLPVTGFGVGGLFFVGADRLLEHTLSGKESLGAMGKSSLKRSLLLVTAITLHNIPEGMAVGVAFGCTALEMPGASLSAAMALALGIGLQNFPEGASVSLPLRRDGMSRWKSFFYGQASGLVEPLAGVIGAAAAVSSKAMLPFLLSFSAGAMIAVAAAELIPESTAQNKTLGAMGVVAGFLVMMLLDIALN